MPTLIDATVVSNFAAIGRLDLLRQQLGTALLAEAVYEELKRGARTGFDYLVGIEDEILDYSERGWLRIVRPEDESEQNAYHALLSDLGRGESMSLAIAGGRGWLFLTDDQPARDFAQAHGILVSGTVGVLIGLLHTGILNMQEGNSLLASMIDRARYRSPVRDLSQVFPT